MEFISREPTVEYCHGELESGQFALVDLMFTYGQHRIQLWYSGPTEHPYSYPDVIGVQF